jgi:thiol:disulfide interchange protein DsbD
MVNPSHETVHGSFAFGIMTAVLSTPCTAPFMGAAAAWAATRSPAVTMATFTAIGVGMALPYLALSAWPKLVEKMPRTGPASELIKQVMGLLMLGAAAYFVGTGIAGWLVTAPDPPTLAYWYFVALFIAAAGGWLAWRTIRLHPSGGKLVSFVLLGAFFIAAAGYIGYHFTRHGPIEWVYYTPQRLETAQQRGDVIVLEFTAQWCLNCHALEQTVLFDSRVVEALNGNHVTAIKVDLTGNNPAGNAKLIDVGSRTIPLLIVLAPDGTEVFKSDAYTIGQVLEAIHKAQGQT